MINLMIGSIRGAYSGIGVQIQRFERSAARVAAPGGPDDYVQEAVEQMSVERAVHANVAVIRAADDMVGTLIDIFA
jgi:hypothetical protein